MTRSFAAAMRRANRMMRSAGMTQATRSFQQTMAGLMVDSALAPLAALQPKKAKPRKATPLKAKPARTKAPKAGRTLGTVLKQLRAAQPQRSGSGGGTTGRTVTPRTPDGAQYLSRRHHTTAGTRSYRLYLPASQPKRPKGLILMLHGCNQTPDDFAVGTHMNVLAEKHGLAIAYPAQTSGNNAAACWNWFRPGDQKRGAGEPALLASLTRKLTRELGLERDAVFVAGLSAGGAMAAILADVYPDVFSAAGVHSGLARGAARDVLSAMSAMRSGGASGGAATGIAAPSKPLRRIVFHGDSDSTVHPSNAAMIVAGVLGGDAAPTKVTSRSVRGRSYTRSDFAGPDGTVLLELWMVEAGGHAWSGGRAAGSYTDGKGPDASVQMIRFFLAGSPAQ
jgi:poly(hydroxyalkanoate) depolymerase family esterase